MEAGGGRDSNHLLLNPDEDVIVDVDAGSKLEIG